MVASDRISAYDWVLPTEIPDKGRVLTQLSLWWFDQLADLVPNHVVSAPSSPGARPTGPARVICEPLTMVPVECVARGYLDRLGPGRVRRDRHGLRPRPARRASSTARELPEPIFTPATKAAVGEHDENVVVRGGRRQVGAETAAALRQLTLAVYGRARDIARERGIILADTKFEFGYDPGRDARPRRRGAHPGLLPLLARRRSGSRATPSRPSTSSSSATG